MQIFQFHDYSEHNKKQELAKTTSVLMYSITTFAHPYQQTPSNIPLPVACYMANTCSSSKIPQQILANNDCLLSRVSTPSNSTHTANLQ